MFYKSPKIVSRETLLPVSVEDLIVQIGADADLDYPDGSPERANLVDHLKSAVEWVENYTGQTILGGEFLFSLDGFPVAGGVIDLGIHPVIELQSVVYDDLNGDEQTLPAAAYDADLVASSLKIAPVDLWPIPQKKFNSVRIQVRAGLVYTDIEEVNNLPQSLRIAILMLAGLYHEHHSAVSPVKMEEVPLGVKSHCDQYRLGWI